MTKVRSYLHFVYLSSGFIKIKAQVALNDKFKVICNDHVGSAKCQKLLKKVEVFSTQYISAFYFFAFPTKVVSTGFKKDILGIY